MVKSINKNKKGQSFSTDVLVVVVIVLFGALFLVMSTINDLEDGPSVEEKYAIAAFDADLVKGSLEEQGIIDSESRVDVDKLLTVDEQTLREELGIKNKFCIVFEKDGKLVKIDPNNDINGIGSEDIIVNDVPCN